MISTASASASSLPQSRFCWRLPSCSPVFPGCRSSGTSITSPAPKTTAFRWCRFRPIAASSSIVTAPSWRAIIRPSPSKSPRRKSKIFRRGSCPLCRPPLPLPRRRGQGTAVPPVSAGGHRLTRAGLHQPHQQGRPRNHRKSRTKRQLQGHRTYRQNRSGKILRVPVARRDRL